MSTIEKLSIQGVRSFGSKAEDVQSITFSSPVTLILGENGCGKTTVIECLKYALTGEYPPGSDRGKSFVHDPKIFSLTDALGQIKLLVRNIRGQRISVCRSMKMSSKRGKMQLETLESTMNYMDGNESLAAKKAESISKRCLDVDVCMCEFMGVSKAIINNVIFCHQEDSSWPLDEAKKLKEKFDAIFGITEYNKAIEKVIKMRKEEADNLKVKEADLRLLAHLKQEMEDKSIALEKAQQKCNSVKDLCNTCDEEMKPIEARLSEIHKIEYEVGKYQSLKVEIETKQKNCREQIGSLSKKIKQPFSGSIHDLDREIYTFKQKMSAKKTERIDLEQKLVDLKVQDKALHQTCAELDRQQCVVVQQLQGEKECQGKRVELMRTLCDQLKISLDEKFADRSESISGALEDIQSGLLNEQCTITELATQHDCSDQQLQVEIDTIRVHLSKLEERIDSLKKQKEQYDKEKQSSDGKINEIEESTQRLKKVTQEIKRIDEFYKKSSESFNQAEMRQAIADSKVQVGKLQTQFRKLDDRLTVLTSISKQMAEVSLKEKELAKKEQEVRRVKAKHSDNFKRIFTKPVERNYRRALQVEYENLRRNVKSLTDKTNDLKLKEQSCEIKRKNLKEELLRSERELEELKETIFDKCHSTPYEELLAKSKELVNKYQLEYGALRSSEAMFKKYMNNIEDEPSCPLCHKQMSGNEVAELSAELTDEIHQLPENMKRTEKMYKLEQRKYEELLQLKPLIEKVAHLEREIPNRKEELKNVQRNVSEYASERESLQLLVAEPTSNMDLTNTMLGDMSLLDEAIKEVARLNEEISNLKGKLPQGCETEDSIEDLQLEKSTVSAELENERSKLDTLQQDYEKATNSLNKLRELKNTFKDEEIKLQEGVQSLPQLKQRQEELGKLLVNCDTEVQDLRDQVQPSKKKLASAITEKANQKDSNRKQIIKLQSKYDEHRKIHHEIQRLSKEVAEYGKLNLEEQLEDLKNNIKINKEAYKQKCSEIAKTTATLDAIKADCLAQETLERDLRDNHELKILQEKEEQLRAEYEELSKQIGDLDFHKVSREKSQLVQKRDLATVRKGELLGQIGEINNQIKKIKSEIEEPKYKASLHNYKRGRFEVDISSRLISDLGQYRIALEWSLMKFHAEKMEKINGLIRQYWRLIYKGNDIDYIQIQTDDINTDASADRRRNYNYRVIQSKNNSEIEMRGRCSAGQRVLASLIIRMALAETFSSNCGVLALDEPTTNLDRVNIVSLCEALNRIVEDRQSQSNFMLIIITHDEDFINALGKITSYHRVFRNDETKSIIRKVEIV